MRSGIAARSRTCTPLGGSGGPPHASPPRCATPRTPPRTSFWREPRPRGEARDETRVEAGAPAVRRGDPLNRCQGAACAGAGLAGQVGSWPNRFSEVDAADLGGFFAALSAMRSEADWLEVVTRHGVRRVSKRFRADAGALTDDMLRHDPLLAGLLDLNRYPNPKPAALID